MGRLFRGEGIFRGELSRGKFTLGGFVKISICNSFYRPCSLFTNSCFDVEPFQGNCPEEFSAGQDFQKKISTGRGISGVIGKTIRNIFFFSNESMLRRILHAESSARYFTERGFFINEGIIWKN